MALTAYGIDRAMTDMEVLPVQGLRSLPRSTDFSTARRRTLPSATSLSRQRLNARACQRPHEARPP